MMGLLTKLKRIDWSIIIILLLFMCVSTMLVYSAIQSQGPQYAGYEKRNLIIYAVGFVALFAATFVDYRLLIRFAIYLYAIGIGMLAAVLRFGSTYNGAAGWFTLPGGVFNIQPAELMKLLLILMIASYLSRREGEPLRFFKDIVPLGIIVLVPFALVMVQPDLGNAIIYLVIFVGMLWIGNVKYLHALIGVTLAVSCLIGMYFFYQSYHDEIEQFLRDRDKGHWVVRIDTYLNPDQVSADASHQIRNSKIAIGSGGLRGEGYLQGEYVHNGFIPYPYSDSIFIVLSEEFGFFGASMLLLLYFLLIYRMIWCAIQCDRLGGSYLIVGIVSMFVFQIFENIGMFLGIMPLTGITLPFISYGGSSLLINMVCVGLVLSTRIYREKPAMY
jgi:rod shape determining protein RodA